MDSLLDWHRSLAWFLIFSNAAVGFWALAAQQWPRLYHRLIWWAIIVAQLSTFAMAIIGVAMSQDETVELDQFHALYGFSAIVAVGVLYSYRTSPFVKGKVLLLYGLGSLFIMGLGIRALFL